MAVSSLVKTDELQVLASSGRIATALWRLRRERFTGVVFVESEEGGAVLSLRDGVPVFAEDLGGGLSLGDSLLEQATIAPHQYAAVLEQVLDDLTGSEDVAFAEKAVELGVLTQAQVAAELERRVRGLVIKVLSWPSARLELDADVDALTGPEFPQSLGSLLYMAVRTFYDEERVGRLLGIAVREPRELYLRLLRARADVADDLGLDELERELLEALDPPSSVRAAIERTSSDMLEALQLVAMLVLAEDVEHGFRPWSAPVEAPSRPRPGRAAPSAMGRYVTREDVQEERLGPAPRPVPPARRAPSAPVAPPAAVADYDFDQRSPTPAPARTPPPVAPREAPAADPSVRARATSAAQTPDESAARQRPARPASTPQTPAFDARPAAPQPAPGPRADARPRRLGAALKRLGKELEDRRAQTQQVEPAASPSPTPTPVAPASSSGQPEPITGSIDRAALRELIRRKRAMTSQQESAAGETRAKQQKGPDLVRSAQDAMREQQFGRAQELFAKACEAEPDNETFKMYRLWAAFRAGAIEDADLTALKTILRDKLNDDQQKAFAYYAMGHIVLADKKEDAAEKFFKKAIELDKNNRDAQRHLRLIELRRKSASSDAANTKIFGIEIGKKS